MTVVRMPSKNHAAKHDTARVHFLHRITEAHCFCQSEGLSCDQGRSCPLAQKPADPEPPRESLALRIFDAACWFAASVVLVTVIYSIDLLDYLMQPHP